jgi:hypothetical protein
MRIFYGPTTISILAAVAILAIAAPSWGEDNPGQPKQNMRQMCSEMMQKMQSEIKSQDAELDQLVKAMNAAKGDQKVQAMAAVVNKLVQQRTAAHAKMAEMCNRMMQGMPEMEPGAAASPSPSTSPTGSP